MSANGSVDFKFEGHTCCPHFSVSRLIESGVGLCLWVVVICVVVFCCYLVRDDFNGIIVPRFWVRV